MSSIDWLTLARIQGIGPVLASRLIAKFGSPESVFESFDIDLKSSGLLNENLLKEFRKTSFREAAETDLDKCEKLGIGICTLDDQVYPKMLRNIHAPPIVLFYRGDISIASASPMIGIVGTRSPTNYGLTVAKKFSADLARSGVVIASGMALGIDAIVHEACLDAGRPTIAVLGGGPDVIYPLTNANIYRRIYEEGLILSEFPPGTRPEAWNFPRRNRIISGLSDGVLVIESGKKGGSLITAYEAVSQGREVFAVPGPITSAMSDGTFRLIRDGATPVREISDILEQLKAPDLFASVKPETLSRVTAPPIDLLPENELLVFNAISDDPLRVDQISEFCKTGLGELYGILLSLELRGLIRQESGQLYVRA